MREKVFAGNSERAGVWTRPSLGTPRRPGTLLTESRHRDEEEGEEESVHADHLLSVLEWNKTLRLTVWGGMRDDAATDPRVC